MGFPFFVSLPDDARPPTEPQNHEENPLYVKHVELRETKPCFASYQRVENSMFIRHMVSSRGTEVLERLMVVKFNSNNKNFIVETLKKGIECNESQYHYLGQSSTQLRNKTCFMIDASLNEMHSLLAKFENFDDIFPVARRVQKFSLLFSPFLGSLELKRDEYDVIDDVASALGTYVFTDGCGLMSPELSREVQNMYNLSHTPSVIEVKFKHFSGVLVRFNEMPTLRVKALFRHSMADFPTPLEAMNEVNTLGIVDFSQPYSLGYLDTQTVMLLAEGGVPRESLETLQADYHEMLQRLEDKTYAGYFLRTTGNEKLLQALQKDGLTNDVVKELHSLKVEEIKIMKSKKIVNDNEENEDKGQFKLTKNSDKVKIDESNFKPTEKEVLLGDASSNNNDEALQDKNGSNLDFDFRIFIPDARVVYGVSDPYGQLNYGECFFQPTLHESELNAFATAAVVVVIRRPSFHVGDVRVLKLTHGKETYKDLYDCIVFPSRGARSHAFECAGGRVSGDKYFVCWDQGLIPRYISSPYMGIASTSSSKIANKVKELVPSFKCMKKQPGSDAEQRKRQQQARQELVEYFGNFKDYEEIRTRATNLFLKYASLFGSTCQECEILKKMFVREFDWSERYDQIARKLTELEEAREKEIKTLSKLSNTAKLPLQPPRPPGAWDRLLISLQWKKPAFCPGDDVWNTMKAKSAEFLASQTNVTIDKNS